MPNKLRVGGDHMCHLEHCFSNWSMHRDRVKCRSDSGGLPWDPRSCISSKVPGDAVADATTAGPQATL